MNNRDEIEKAAKETLQNYYAHDSSKNSEDDAPKTYEEAALNSKNQDTSERKKYAALLFSLVSVWLIFVMVMISLQGCGNCSFQLSDSIIISLLGTSLVTVLALFKAVNNYLFNEKHIDKGKD